jgi:lipid A 4'-phosphatase
MTSQLVELAQFTKSRSVLALKYAVPVCLVLAMLFLFLPEVDLSFSRLFFRDETLQYPVYAMGFWLAKSSFLQLICKAVTMISKIVLIGSVVVCVRYLLIKNAKAFYAAVVMFSLIIGPLYMVNGVFKEAWGRARPDDLAQFGGAKQFTPAWVMSDQCEHNCAFTSGHAAAGYVLCLGFFISRSRIWLPMGIALGMSIGLVRMMIGAHFLSDVIFSFFIVFIVAAIVGYLLSQLTLMMAKPTVVPHS